MYPYGWDSGERQVARKTFKDFMDIPKEILDVAVAAVLGLSHQDLFEDLMSRFNAANDNDDGLADRAIKIFIDKDLMDMLRCWHACNKDMVLTRLTYEQGVNYGKPN